MSAIVQTPLTPPQTDRQRSNEGVTPIIHREFISALETVLDRIVEGYQPQKIILFGSLAWGQPDEDSDIDLLIVKESNETPLERRVNVRRIATIADRRIAFSPLVLTPNELQSRLDQKDTFYQKIVEQGTLLYER